MLQYLSVRMRSYKHFAVVDYDILLQLCFISSAYTYNIIVIIITIIVLTHCCSRQYLYNIVRILYYIII